MREMHLHRVWVLSPWPQVQLVDDAAGGVSQQPSPSRSCHFGQYWRGFLVVHEQAQGMVLSCDYKPRCSSMWLSDDRAE